MTTAQNRKYSVTMWGTSFIVTNNRNNTERTYCYGEFIYGQPMFNPETDELPNYIHREVHQLWKRRQSVQILEQTIGGK